jgi:uncharacterized membrane protein
MKTELDWYDLIIHGLFASLGGVVRELKEPENDQIPKKLLEFVSGGFIGIFCGLVIYFICRQYNVGEYLTVALTGLGGYLGTPALDFIAKIVKGKVKTTINN